MNIEDSASHSFKMMIYLRTISRRTRTVACSHVRARWKSTLNRQDNSILRYSFPKAAKPENVAPDGLAEVRGHRALVKGGVEDRLVKIRRLGVV